MAPKKEDGGVLDQKRQDGSYARAQPSSSSPSSPSAVPPTSPSTASAAAGPSTAVDPLERAPTYEEAIRSTGAIPTIDSPFNFPTNAELPPSYEAHAEPQAEGSSSSSAIQAKPIAIPQVVPDSSSPLLSAYPPSLLSYGITEQTWRSFLETVSAFLTAKVSDRAIAHAGDAARSMGEPPKNYGKSLVNHTKTIGKQIARDGKRFNIFGVVGGFIGGAISIPMHLAFGAVHTIFEIPAAAINSVSKTPKTALQRAATYSAVANKDWFNARGLHAVLVDTKQLAEMIHMRADKFLEVAATGGKNGSAATMMGALDGHIEKLNVGENETVALSGKTLWLVLVPVVKEVEEETETKTETKTENTTGTKQNS